MTLSTCPTLQNNLSTYNNTNIEEIQTSKKDFQNFKYQFVYQRESKH